MIEELWALDFYRRSADALIDEQFVINLAVTDLATISANRISGLAWNLYKCLVTDRVVLGD